MIPMPMRNEPIEELSFGSISSSTRPPHRKRVWLRIVISMIVTILVLGSAGGAWMWEYHWRMIDVTANGRTLQVRADTTLGTVLKSNNQFNQRPGRLLDITGGTIEQTGGEPITTSLNGQIITSDKLETTKLFNNANITVSAGKDVTEEHTVEHEPIPHGSSINLVGTIQLLKQSGKDGEREYWVGKRSHKRVDKEITQQPQDLIVESVTPRPKNHKVIALTFDDGPSPFSSKILDILKEKGVKATFFDVGQNAQSYPAAEQRMVAEGHEVCSHSNTHANLPKLNRDALRSELQAGFTNLELASGTKTKVLRAPYGAFGKQQWIDAHDLIDMNVIWDIDTLDWKRPGEQAIHDAVLNNAHNGAIALMHDGGGDRSQDVAALPSIIDDLKAQGYEFVTIRQLLELSGINM